MVPNGYISTVVFRFLARGREEQISCLNQTLFSPLFHYGMSEILLKSKILLKSNVLKSKNYCTSKAKFLKVKSEIILILIKRTILVLQKGFDICRGMYFTVFTFFSYLNIKVHSSFEYQVGH